MPAPDHSFKIVTQSSGQRLALLGNVPSDSWEPVASEVQTVERFADRAFRARHRRESFVVYMEATTYWDDNVRWSVLAKSGLLSERERLTTVSLVFVLHPRGYKPQDDAFRLHALGAEQQSVAFRQVPFWDLVPDPSWEDAPGLMALYPLSRHREPEQRAILHAADAIERGERDPVRRADLLTVLGIFGRLAYPHLNPFALIGRQNMRDSPGYQQIMDEGSVLTFRNAILLVLEERFGKRAARSVELGVNAVEDLSRLNELVRASGRCTTIDEFRDVLEGREPVRKKRVRRP